MLDDWSVILDPPQSATHRKKTPPQLPPGLVTYDNLAECLRDRDTTPEKEKAASDGSGYDREQIAAAAWIIATGTEHQTQACFFIANMKKVTSYRSELEGVFRALKHIKYLNWTPRELDQWCDNK